MVSGLERRQFAAGRLLQCLVQVMTGRVVLNRIYALDVIPANLTERFDVELYVQ